MNESCLDCIHCVCNYQTYYSEVTPGDGIEFECSKGRWNLSNEYSFTKEKIKESIFDNAAVCKFFSGTKKEGE